MRRTQLGFTFLVMISKCIASPKSLLIFDSCTHAITALIGVRRALRLRKNYVKLAMYNHFAYTLIFSLLATLAFTIWLFVEFNFPKAGCLEVCYLVVKELNLFVEVNFPKASCLEVCYLVMKELIKLVCRGQLPQGRLPGGLLSSDERVIN